MLDDPDPEVWARMERANDPQGGPLTAEERRVLRRVCVEIPAADLATIDAFKVKKFVRSHGLTNHKTEEIRYAATLKSLQDHIDWRRQVCLDDFLRPETEVGARVLKSLRRWRQLWGSEIYGVTQAGVPVMYHHMGGLKPDEILEEYPGDSMEDGLILDLELCEKLNQELSRQEGRTINLGAAVIDLRGISMDLMAPRLLSKIKMMIDLPSNHYPESLTHMYIVNAPLAFRGFWRLVLPFIPEENKLKISLIGTDQTALDELFLREGIDTRRFPQEVGGEVPAGESPAMGWLGAAFQRAASTGQYYWEGVDLESPTDKRCLDPSDVKDLRPSDAAQDTPDDEQSSASIEQPTAEPPSSLEDQNVTGVSSESGLMRSPARRREHRQEQQRTRPHRQVQRERPKRSTHGYTQRPRTRTSALAAQSPKARAKQGGRKFSCCAAAPQEAPRAARRTRQPVGVIAARAPDPSELQSSTEAATQSADAQKDLHHTDTDWHVPTVDEVGLPITPPPEARAQRELNRSTETLPAPATSSDGFATWCMSATGSDAPHPVRLPASPNEGAGANAAGYARADSSTDGTVAAYWTSVQSSLQGVLSSSDSHEKYSKYWCVKPDEARVDLDLTPSEDDGSGGDSPSYYQARARQSN